jgi:hypothetical protein
MKKYLILLSLAFIVILSHSQNYEKQSFCKGFQEHLEQLYTTTKVTYNGSTIIVTMDLWELAKLSEIPVADARMFVSDTELVDMFAEPFIEVLGAYNPAERKVVNSMGFYTLKAIFKDDYSHQSKKYHSSKLTFYR